MLDEQSKHLAYIVGHALREGVRTVEVSEEAEEGWVQTIIDLARFSLDFQESCTPGYYNNEGQPGSITRQNGPYGGGPNAFIRLITDWREAGGFEGLELTPCA
jgi:cyclohexanone monooxygenase